MDSEFTLKEIQFLTGHPSTDAVRMALRRSGLRASGFSAVSGGPPGDWPPKKIWEARDVWAAFAMRIIDRAGEDEEVRAEVWKTFGTLIHEWIKDDKNLLQARLAAIFGDLS
jgi:hypothetical protein